ncbi:MAG: matrixin family metalloprotease [Thermoanaerobaculia bacterium]
MLKPRIQWTFLALISSALAAAPGVAATYSMMLDEDLFDESSVVARVKVLTVSPAPAVGTPSTDYIVLVERVLKGRVSGTTVVVRVPGGVRPDGIGLAIHGAPRFEEGDRALLFLSPRSDGTYGVQQLMLGAFHELDWDGRRAALRRLEGARLVGNEDFEEFEYVRDWNRFQEWLADRAGGVRREADYFSVADSSESVSLPSLLKFRGTPIRFFEFDDGGKVVWEVGRGLKKAKKAFKRAAKTWNSDPDTVVNLAGRGRTSNQNGFVRSDGVNAIIFNDPNNEVQGVYSCTRGGVIALGGAWFFKSPAMVQRIPKSIGKGKANVAIEADVITNDGAKCLLSGDLEATEQVLAHELGHTLGLGHSCGSGCTGRERKALMWAFFHDDGRGARLEAWDRQWLDKLY